MNRNPSNADVWVIHQQTAHLFRQRENTWAEELNLPFAEFSGSATALSSFSQIDTQVYLNVGLGTQTPEINLEKSWAGIATDPLRLLHAPFEAAHEAVLRDLKIMGKTALIISAGQPAQFQHAPSLALIDTTELKHLQHHLKQLKKGTGSWLPSMLFCMRLWLDPKPAYQLSRVLTVAGLVAGAMLMHGLNDTELNHRENRAIQQARKTVERETEPEQQLQFSPWIEQVRKFGQAERANIRSMKVSWAASGNIHTQVDLARDRKRVPKGCSLLETTTAQCSTGEAPK